MTTVATKKFDAKLFVENLLRDPNFGVITASEGRSYAIYKELVWFLHSALSNTSDWDVAERLVVRFLYAQQTSLALVLAAEIMHSSPTRMSTKTADLLLPHLIEGGMVLKPSNITSVPVGQIMLSETRLDVPTDLADAKKQSGVIVSHVKEHPLTLNEWANACRYVVALVDVEHVDLAIAVGRVLMGSRRDGNQVRPSSAFFDADAAKALMPHLRSRGMIR